MPSEPTQSDTQGVLLDRFLKSSAGQKLAAEFEAEKYEARVTLVDEIENLKRERSEKLPPLLAAERDACKRMKEAGRELEAAKNAFYHAQSDVQGVKFLPTGQIARRERKLRDTAPQPLRDFLAELREIEKRQCVNQAEIREDHTDFHILLGRNSKKKTFSNIQSIERMQQAIKLAREQVESMLIEAIEPAELARQIEALRQSIPDSISFDRVA